MDTMQDKSIGIEVSLTSNVQTSTVADYQFHPVKTFLRRNMLAALCTDDPGISGIDLCYEYEIAAPQVGLSSAQIQQVQRNAVEIAFLTKEEKSALLAQKRSKAKSVV
jgi:adenosine deaminase